MPARSVAMAQTGRAAICSSVRRSKRGGTARPLRRSRGRQAIARHVDGHQQHAAAHGRGAVQKVVADHGISRRIQLEPEALAGELGRTLDRGRGDRAQAERDVRPAGGLGQILRDARPDQAAEPDRRHADRRVVAPPEQGDRQVRRRAVLQIARLHDDRIERAAVARERDLLVAAAFQIVEGEAGNSSSGAFLQIGDRGSACQQRCRHSLIPFVRPSSRRLLRGRAGTSRSAARRVCDQKTLLIGQT